MCLCNVNCSKSTKKKSRASLTQRGCTHITLGLLFAFQQLKIGCFKTAVLKNAWPCYRCSPSFRSELIVLHLNHNHKIAVSLSFEKVQTFLSLIAEERIQWELDGATPKEKALCIYFWTCYIFRVCLLFIFLPLYVCFASIENNLIE